MSSKLHQEAVKDTRVLPFTNNSLPDFVIKKCTDELREIPETKECALGELVNYLKGNPKTSGTEFERDFLVHYLRVNKYDVKKSLKHIQNYVDLWNKEGFLFKGIPDDYFSSKISTSFCALLPERCPDGCPVILFRIGKWDTNEMKFTDILKIIAATHLQLFRDPMTQINGIKTIYDFKGTSFQHLRNILNDKLYLINHIPMVHFLSDPKRLCDYFSPSILPAEYGGEIQNIDSQEWIRRINREQKNFTIGGQPNFY
ncbi:alpha-tocopherol transfer protein-like isoform X2 [Argiope bruennichi]|uniref:alpha-tocopherol transfer protein-like isoform X2 n=1 Tax=Argiope bruennichi TaxID=94029 RepID=UPI0024953009|nr:alpha-tocopherol transfer protein-like isoform X2 [Argiope bruennichi]